MNFFANFATRKMQISIFTKIKSSLLLIFIILWISTPVIKLIDYGINYNEYLENCINLDKPELNCNGKCGLMIQEQEENQKPTLKIESHEFSIAYLDVFPINLKSNEALLNKFSNFKHYNILELYSCNLFKPPIS